MHAIDQADRVITQSQANGKIIENTDVQSSEA